MATNTDATERIPFEQDLRESEERFRRAFDEAPIGMALATLDGRLFRVNSALCRFVGYTPEELAARTFQDITHPDDLGSNLERHGQLARNEVALYKFEKRYVRKDGTIVNGLISGSVIHGRDGAPLYFVGHIEDITERKRIEQDLRESEERFRLAFDEAPIGMALATLTGRLFRVNSALCRFVGYTPEELTARTFQDITHSDDLGSNLERHGQLARNEVALYKFEKRYVRKDSTIVNGLISGSVIHGRDGAPLYFVGHIEDITERKRIEQERQFLAEAAAVLASSLDYGKTLTSVAQLAVHHIADLCIVDLIGVEGGLHRLTIAHAEPAKAAACEELARIQLDRRRGHLGRSAVETKETVIWIDVTSEVLEENSQSAEHLQLLRDLGLRSGMAVPLLVHGDLLGTLVLGSSLEGRYRPPHLGLVEELARRAALAIEHARLYETARRATQARDDLLGIVAHDLRNPLNSIHVAAHVLGRQVSKEGVERDAKSLETIRRSILRANRLIEDLLDVTRVEAGHLSVERRRLPADQLVFDAVEGQQLLATSSSLEFRLEVERPLPEVWADHDRILQVLENLLGNAIKFTPPGGRVTVGAAHGDGEVQFWVADTGEGISAESLPHVFERFWQAKRADRSGAGLGLQICKGIVDAHGGRIWVESTPGLGTTFRFTVLTWRAVGDQSQETTDKPRPS